MRPIRPIFLISFLLLSMSFTSFAKDWTIDVVVDKTGAGDYTTITEAINNKPGDGEDYVIFIKDGIYNEKLFITTNKITLLGESRDGTVITQAILRRIFREDYPEKGDWGVATINIDNSATELTLANLTVQNNFADLNPDISNNNDHTMTIRGGGDKVIIVNCNITATGGDTLSLWNTDGGRYYHSGCFFNGYVDYVCPRGYCYISNSDFFGYNGNASIWHDGSGGKDHKFVVKNSYFDGVENFGLGRYHRMAAFYLLDCDFTENIRDNGGINYVGDSTSGNDRDKLIYGPRVYYDRCNRESGNYPWHSDNLSDAEGSPSSDMVTSTWTFNNTWDPEKEITGLLECAFLPIPGYHTKEVELTPELSWLPGKDAVQHLLYFGTDSTPDFKAAVTDTTYSITEPLEGITRYFWRVDEVTGGGDTITGPLWNFFTQRNGKPTVVSNPFPTVDTNLTKYTIILDWKANALEVDSFMLYFGVGDSIPLLSTQAGIGYTLTGLKAETMYAWHVDAMNEFGITEGPMWTFGFKLATSVNNSSMLYADGIKIYPNPMFDELTIELSIEKQVTLSIISVTDVTGKVIYSENLGMLKQGVYKHQLQKSALGAGFLTGYHILKVSLDNEISSLPFIIK